MTKNDQDDHLGQGAICDQIVSMIDTNKSNESTMPQPTKPFAVLPATPSNLTSLATIVPRSFHPTNPYILRLLPNTPTIQQWWTKIFTSKINSPSTSHVLTAVSTTNPLESLGLLSMQRLGPDEGGAGFWSSFPPTADHDVDAYADVTSGLAEAREKYMAGQEHFVIELFGVDHEIKGFGLGKMLLLKACEIADEAGLPIFVMANASARGIYQHPGIGFELKEVKILPGELQYEEYMLVRPVGGAC